MDEIKIAAELSDESLAQVTGGKDQLIPAGESGGEGFAFSAEISASPGDGK